MDACYLNGEYLPLAEARISPMDRGFLFGDAVYEGIVVYNHRGFLLREHLERLQRSLDKLNITVDWSLSEWEDMINTLISQVNEPTQLVYLQVSRGAAAQRNHIYRNLTPTIFAYATPAAMYDVATLEQGYSAITAPDERWHHCEVKSVNLIPNVMWRQRAEEQGAAEAIFVRDGIVTEGTASNVFIVKDNTLITHPIDQHILGGITRDHILKLATQHDMTSVERQFSVEELENADEIWVTSTSKPIFPITKLNNRPVSNGKPGQFWQSMIYYYTNAITKG